MDVTPRTITVRELVTGYTDDDDGGVVGYGGLLDIRPKFQREFVYKDKQQQAVIDSVSRNLPLNVMYWAKIVADDGSERFEVLDGQQRTISLCRYVAGGFADERTRYFHNLTDGEKDAILDYELMVYVCDGSEAERLEWFERINIAGEKLTDQELRNAVYAGPWLSDAKRFFSRTGGPAAMVSEKVVKGVPIRQELLEKAIAWIARSQKLDSIEAYMAAHQHDPQANELKKYFRDVVGWARDTFRVTRREFVSVDWAALYDKHGSDGGLDPVALETRVAALMADDEVTKKAGIYPYVLSGDPRTLSLRAFSASDRSTMFARQGGLCAKPSLTGHDPKVVFTIEQMEADHVTPWSQGGRTELANGQMLCRACNRAKSDD